MQLEQTDDGSYTLYVPELEEHYHSIKGALTESEHIFINMGMKHFRGDDVRILEIGFGTGLNAFLTLLEADKEGRNVYYSSIERYPIPLETVEKLQYPELICPERADDFNALHKAAWNTDVHITSRFTLNKIEDDFTTYRFKPGYDVIYFDAFAPEKQPEMWNQELFDALYGCLNKGGVLTTYCAKGVVRRMLQASGFTVERLPGPPGGKREILRATKA
ncbi:tRNA (5-methylaminomethyl-2-thiouridine)(34)-methyltransferase MnmD [uncultured Bacteroides sp.]|uniref:tRNA (5-methylaminomethyl-2-thiouridine)(34)-methyltransferase MnmD n=1 Tax=uncultured Bacteroides sp. TaxID=162156 RepID=UPI00260536A4|nr:tRNA (5-methylaminomethyl-2-thiouridine)(34)-methyltransferase MnmD [uncultured Bacteroides sp.]